MFFNCNKLLFSVFFLKCYPISFNPNGRNSVNFYNSGDIGIFSRLLLLKCFDVVFYPSILILTFFIISIQPLG